MLGTPEIVADELRRWAASKPNRRIEMTARLAETERKLEHLIDLAAATGSSTVAQRVRDLEAARSVLRAELGALKDAAPIIPSPAEMARRVLSLERLTTSPPDVAREKLRTLLKDGRIYGMANEDRTFTLRWGLLPVALLQSPHAERPPEGFSPGRPSDTFGCGGWI